MSVIEAVWAVSCVLWAVAAVLWLRNILDYL